MKLTLIVQLIFVYFHLILNSSAFAATNREHLFDDKCIKIPLLANKDDDDKAPAFQGTK